MYDQLPVDKSMLADFLALSPQEHRELRKRILQYSLARGLTYQKRPGLTEAMNLIPLPAALPIAHARYLARICHEIIAMVKRIVPLYLDSPPLRETLPLLPPEEEWLRECWRPAHGGRQPIIYRLDADMLLASPRAAQSARFFESNSVAVGGMFYTPVAESIIADATLRKLYGAEGISDLQPNEDTRLIILRELASHARALGRRDLTIAMIEDKSWDVGITELPSLVRFFRRQGIRAYLADPRELSLERGDVRYRGRIIDIAYRNTELRDLIELEGRGARLAALRELFKRNQIISSISGEFDHKSLFEVFTDARFRALFTGRQRALLARHIPWTRLIYERNTIDRRGHRIDLPRFTTRNRERLVIKPNRHCGGEGVAIGIEMAQGRWEQLVNKALGEPGEWVVQERIDNKVKRLPWFTGREGFQALPLYTAYGFISTAHGFGMVGRACRERVVNIASGGALLSVFKLPS
jgi:hypothetical protein